MLRFGRRLGFPLQGKVPFGVVIGFGSGGSDGKVKFCHQDDAAERCAY